jgi:hypothetical protein
VVWYHERANRPDPREATSCLASRPGDGKDQEFSLTSTGDAGNECCPDDGSMLLAIRYRPATGRTVDDRRRIRELFMAWKPPAGIILHAHYHFVSGGGVMILDAAEPGPIFETLEPFKPQVEFDVEPVVNLIEAVAVSLNIEEWASSVSSPQRD